MVESTGGFGISQPGHVVQRYVPPGVAPPLVAGALTTRNNFSTDADGGVYANTPAGRVVLVPPTPPEPPPLPGLGDSWTVRPDAGMDAESWDRGFAYGGGRFVAVSGSPGAPVRNSTDGVAWTPATNPPSQPAGNVAYGAGRWVATTSTLQAFTSPDALTWTPQTVPINAGAVVYGGGQFVSVATGAAMTSPDGLAWTAQTAPATSWQRLAYGGGRYVALANTGTQRVMTSPDGVTWTAHALATILNGPAYGAGRWVGVGFNLVMTSPDGATWTNGTMPAGAWNAVAYGGGMFAAVGSSGIIATSPDGLAWTVQPAVTTGTDFRFVAYGAGRFVAVASNGTNRVMTSP